MIHISTFFVLAMAGLFVWPSCGDSREKAPNGNLWKHYKRDVGAQRTGDRFYVGDLGNRGVCQEVADMYNSKPSVVQAGVLVFTCGPSGDD